MKLAYPVEIEQDDEGWFLVTFPDVPEAATDDRDRDTAMEAAFDALLAALGGYVETRLPIPEPSPAHGRSLIPLPPLIAAKLALHQALVEADITNSELARRMGASETIVRRLLDLDHASKIERIADALDQLGRRLVISVEAA